jgi:hypothetical protein
MLGGVRAAYEFIVPPSWKDASAGKGLGPKGIGSELVQSIASNRTVVSYCHVPVSDGPSSGPIELPPAAAENPRASTAAPAVPRAIFLSFSMVFLLPLGFSFRTGCGR